MPKFTTLAPGGWGEKGLREFGYAMVMEVDGRVELSGQGGWDPATLDFPTGRPIEAEINQAFDNVAFMLNAVGLDWRNVAHVNSYHVPEPDGAILAATAEMGRQFRRGHPREHCPISGKLLIQYFSISQSLGGGAAGMAGTRPAITTGGRKFQKATPGSI